jgi:hypothetical protein
MRALLVRKTRSGFRSTAQRRQTPIRIGKPMTVKSWVLSDIPYDTMMSFAPTRPDVAGRIRGLLAPVNSKNVTREIESSCCQSMGMIAQI